jgi:hypothetical protein
MSIFERANELMDEIWPDKALRGMGVRVSELVPNDFLQISLYEPYNKKKNVLMTLLTY